MDLNHDLAAELATRAARKHFGKDLEGADHAIVRRLIEETLRELRLQRGENQRENPRGFRPSDKACIRKARAAFVYTDMREEFLERIFPEAHALWSKGEILTIAQVRDLGARCGSYETVASALLVEIDQWSQRNLSRSSDDFPYSMLVTLKDIMRIADDAQNRVTWWTPVTHRWLFDDAQRRVAREVMRVRARRPLPTSSGADLWETRIMPMALEPRWDLKVLTDEAEQSKSVLPAESRRGCSGSCASSPFATRRTARSPS